MFRGAISRVPPAASQQLQRTATRCAAHGITPLNRGVAAALERGVLRELRIHASPGYCLYFGQRGSSHCRSVGRR
jgi:putative component of toxin-antitoxin plasmid stabilization module